MEVLIPEHVREQYTDLDLNAIANSDIALMKAWTMLKRESCPKCGMPIWLGHSTNNYVQFDVDESMCHSCIAVEKHESSQPKNTSRAGIVSYPVLKMMFDAPRPTREESYAAMRDND